MIEEFETDKKKLHSSSDMLAGAHNLNSHYKCMYLINKVKNLKKIYKLMCLITRVYSMANTEPLTYVFISICSQ